MKLFKITTIGLLALTVLAVSSTTVVAHNSAKYTNIPFVVAGACLNDDPSASAQFVTLNGVTQLMLVANNDHFDTAAQIYCSNPGAPGRSTNDLQAVAGAAGTFPQSTLTFSVNSPSSNAVVVSYVIYSDGSNSGYMIVPLSNGVGTVLANAPQTPGSTVAAIYAGLNSSNGSRATVYFSNFRLNNQPVLLDTTIKITSC